MQFQHVKQSIEHLLWFQLMMTGKKFSMAVEGGSTLVKITKWKSDTLQSYGFLYSSSSLALYRLWYFLKKNDYVIIFLDTINYSTAFSPWAACTCKELGECSYVLFSFRKLFRIAANTLKPKYTINSLDFSSSD